MKHEKQLTMLTGSLLAFVTAWGTVGCLISAFDLRTENFSGLIFAIALFSLICSILLSFRQGGPVLLCLLALGCGYLYHDGRAAQQFWQLLHNLTTIYDRAYGWGVLVVEEASPAAAFADWPLGILGCLTAIAVSRCICRQKSVWLPVLTVILPLCTCIVVTDTVPGELYLMMVMAGLILLILTTAVRRENTVQGLRLTAMAALPVILALLVLFLAVPQKGYVNQSEILRENIILAVRNIPRIMETGMTQLASGLQSQPPKQVDLANLGARIPFTYPVMEVTAENSGTLYLRDQDYDCYTGLGWTADTTREETFSQTTGSTEVITIRTENRKNIRYLPYYPAFETILTGGMAENPGEETEYTVSRNLLPEDWRQTAYGETVPSKEWPQYLTLPDATRQGAAEFLEGLYREDASNTEKADLIAALVLDSAAYDLNTGKMPPAETDFALWFLREGETGYCIHFATAAAVLLRAAGVPARYVTGYMLEAEAGQAVPVTEENSHAWAEYFEPGLNAWIPLEATPAEAIPEESTLSRPPVTQETTQPPETTVPEITESVTESTLPPETTVPEMPISTPTEPPAPTKKGTFPSSVLLLPLLALVLAMQRSVRLTLRRRRQRSGDPNRQALRRWQEAVRLSQLLKESPTEELIVLAQKAKFSQHALTQDELLQFDSFNRICLRRLREKPWYLRLIYQFIYAAY